MKVKTFLVIILLTLISCQKEVASCDCSRIDLYGILNDITFIIRISEDDIRSGGIRTQIKNTQQIDSIKNLVLNLEPLNEDYKGIDVRIVLDLICKNGGKSTVLLNRGIAQIGNNYYEINEDLLDFIRNNRE